MNEYIIPGEYRLLKEDIELNANRKKLSMVVSNTGDRPIQVGSHIHFVETNRQLLFERELAIGMRLDIPAGTAVRFEPGQEMEVNLTEIGGNKEVFGIGNLTNGSIENKELIMKRAKELNYKGAE